jgi:hypothetical protein
MYLHPAAARLPTLLSFRIILYWNQVRFQDHLLLDNSPSLVWIWKCCSKLLTDWAHRLARSRRQVTSGEPGLDFRYPKRQAVDLQPIAATGAKFCDRSLPGREFRRLDVDTELVIGVSTCE